MLLNDTLQLLTKTITNDEYLIQREQLDGPTVFCDTSSVGASEFYEAAQTGLQPEYRFTILVAEYNGQTLVKYHGQILSVYRTYRRSNDYIELYTERRQGDGGQG